MSSSSNQQHLHALPQQLDNRYQSPNCAKQFPLNFCISTAFTTKRGSISSNSNSSAYKSQQVQQKPLNTESFSNKSYLSLLPGINIIKNKQSYLIPPFNRNMNEALPPSSERSHLSNIKRDNFFIRKLSEPDAIIRNQSSSLEKHKLSMFQNAGDDRIRTEANLLEKKNQNTEYFALVNSICKNHKQFLHKDLEKVQKEKSKRQQESKNYEYSQDKERISSTIKSASNQKINSQNNNLSRKIRDVPELSDNQDTFDLAKKKWIADRKWIIKNKKKILAESQMSINEFENPSQYSHQLNLNQDKFIEEKLHATYSILHKGDADENLNGDSSEIQTYRYSSGANLLEEDSDFATPRGIMISTAREISPKDSGQLRDIKKQYKQETRTLKHLNFNLKNENQFFHSEESELQPNLNLPSFRSQQSKKGTNLLKQAQSIQEVRVYTEPNLQSEKVINQLSEQRQIQQPQRNEKIQFKQSRTIWQSSLSNLDGIGISQRNVKLAKQNHEQYKIEEILFKDTKSTNNLSLLKEDLREKIKQERGVKKEKAKKSRHLNDIEGALLGRGLINDKEDTEGLNAIKLRITHYFRQKGISQEEQELTFKKLEQQVHEINLKNKNKYLEISNMLRNMKPFFLKISQQQDQNQQQQPKSRSINDLLLFSKQIA